MIDFAKHFPVMLQEVLESISPRGGELYVDATFGNGGYSEAILSSANCKVIALDRDPSVKTRAEELKKQFGERFEFRIGQFGDFLSLVPEKINGAVFDIGVSSMQLDQAERGFSFAKEAPRDMRMSKSGATAADLVNSLEEKELADIIYRFGEEKNSRAIAKRIIMSRNVKPIETTTELANIIYQVNKKKYNQIDPATRTFQALRIAVNDELGELAKGLEGATERLQGNGRLVVVDFHSLEDRLVKNFFKQKSGKNITVSRYMPLPAIKENVVFSKYSKAILPSEEEISKNKRSRSAKLRFAIKCQTNEDANV